MAAREKPQYDDEPRVFFKWGTISWIAVALGGAFALLVTMNEAIPDIVGYVVGALIAIGGGIGFAIHPTASLKHKPRPMTPKAARKAARRDGGGEFGTGSGAAGAGSPS